RHANPTIVWLVFAGCPTTDGKVWRTYCTVESLRPMTAKEAQPFIVEPAGSLPSSARNVQFGFFHEWKAFTDIVRFEETPEDCIATAEKWIADENAKKTGYKWPGIRPLADVLGPTERDDGVIVMNDDWTAPNTDPFRARWFKPQEIKEGVVA